jgi:hypothetical protein
VIFLQHIFADCYFDEAIFLILGGENKNKDKDVSW